MRFPLYFSLDLHVSINTWLWGAELYIKCKHSHMDVLSVDLLKRYMHFIFLNLVASIAFGANTKKDYTSIVSLTAKIIISSGSDIFLQYN